MAFRFPGGDERTIFVGATGTGKTTAASWLLAHPRFDKRPWVIFDYKREILFEETGFPPLQEIRLGKLPSRKDRGLYVCFVNPNEDEAVEAYIWQIWERGNIGLFFDEAALLPDKQAVRAILRQGRSKRLPVIACTQRPVWVQREFFSEANYYGIFRLNDRRDNAVVHGFVPDVDLNAPENRLPRHYWRWYDVSQNQLWVVKPVPPMGEIVELLKDRVPYRWNPFRLFAA